jgi:hypothetical protein
MKGNCSITPPTPDRVRNTDRRTTGLVVALAVSIVGVALGAAGACVAHLRALRFMKGEQPFLDENGVVSVTEERLALASPSLDPRGCAASFQWPKGRSKAEDPWRAA